MNTAYYFRQINILNKIPLRLKCIFKKKCERAKEKSFSLKLFPRSRTFNIINIQTFVGTLFHCFAAELKINNLRFSHQEKTNLKVNLRDFID